MATTPELLRDSITPQLLSEIREVWFQHLKCEDSIIVPELSEVAPWFRRDSAFDKTCVDRLGRILDSIRLSEVVAGDLLKYVDTKSPLDWLSLVLLLDQIPRNSYRDSESRVVFNHYDPIALDITFLAIKNEIPEHPLLRYQLGYRLWFYLPLMHSEKLDVHVLAVKEYRQMRRDVEELEPEMPNPNDELDYRARLTQKKELAKTLCLFQLDAEDRHRKIIEQLGRYPHRNDVLGRTHTAEGKEYLKNGGETFDGRRLSANT